MRPATPEDLELFGSLKANRCPPGHFIGEGQRVVRRMLERGVAKRILCTPEWAAKLTIPAGVDLSVADAAALKEIVGFRLHTGVLALGEIPKVGPLTGSLFLALDRLSNAENVGSILRASAAFGVDAVIVGPGTASPWMRRAIRVSIGAPLVVPVHFVEDLAGFCRGRDAWAAHIHGDRHDFREVDYAKPVTLVLGSEADGVAPEVLAACKGTIFIPMAEEWDCLNVGASAAVLLAEVQRQRSKRNES